MNYASLLRPLTLLAAFLLTFALTVVVTDASEPQHDASRTVCQGYYDAFGVYRFWHAPLPCEAK